MQLVFNELIVLCVLFCHLLMPLNKENTIPVFYAEEPRNLILFLLKCLEFSERIGSDGAPTSQKERNRKAAKLKY
jgi:hypothetical protein